MGISQADLAVAVTGTNRKQTVSDWENDKIIPEVRHQMTAARVLKVPVLWLVSGDGEPQPESPTMEPTQIDLSEQLDQIESSALDPIVKVIKMEALSAVLRAEQARIEAIAAMIRARAIERAESSAEVRARAIERAEEGATQRALALVQKDDEATSPAAPVVELTEDPTTGLDEQEQA